MFITTLIGNDTTSPTKVNLAALILRLGLAVIFLIHGLEKIVYHEGGTSWVNQRYGSKPGLADRKPKAEREQIVQMPASLAFPARSWLSPGANFWGGSLWRSACSPAGQPLA